MAREIDNPDRRGKDMDMDDVRKRYYCLDCGVARPETSHEDDCKHADEDA